MTVTGFTTVFGSGDFIVRAIDCLVGIAEFNASVSSIDIGSPITCSLSNTAGVSGSAQAQFSFNAPSAMAFDCDLTIAALSFGDAVLILYDSGGSAIDSVGLSAVSPVTPGTYNFTLNVPSSGYFSLEIRSTGNATVPGNSVSWVIAPDADIVICPVRAYYMDGDPVYVNCAP